MIIFVAVTQIIAMNNTFNDMDELYKLMPSYLNNNKSNNISNKTIIKQTITVTKQTIIKQTILFKSKQ